MPVVGILNGQSADSYSHLTATLYLGLKETGFVEGQNVLIEYRWAERAFPLCSLPVAIPSDLASFPTSIVPAATSRE